MSMVYTILLGSTASTATIDNTLAQKALEAKLVQSNLDRWTKELCAVFGGCTMNIVDGNYIMDNGELCIESSFQFTCYLIGSDADAANTKATWRKVKSIAADMAEVFGQECVLISRAKCKAELVRA